MADFNDSWGEVPAVVRHAYSGLEQQRMRAQLRKTFETIPETWMFDMCKVIYAAGVQAPVSEEFSGHYYAAHIRKTYGPSKTVSLYDIATQYPSAKSPFLEFYTSYWIERDIWTDFKLCQRDSGHQIAVDAVDASLKDQPLPTNGYDELALRVKRMGSAAKVDQRRAKILAEEISAERIENADLRAENMSLTTKINSLLTKIWNLNEEVVSSRANDEAAEKLKEIMSELDETKLLVREKDKTLVALKRCYEEREAASKSQIEAISVLMREKTASSDDEQRALRNKLNAKDAFMQRLAAFAMDDDDLLAAIHANSKRKIDLSKGQDSRKEVKRAKKNCDPFGS